MCTNLLDPKMDFIFKSIFGNEKEKSVLLSFLNAAIKSDSPIVDVEMRNVEITKEAIADKNSRLDVKAVANDGTIINVEIQLRSSDEVERERYRMREKGKLDEISALATAEEKGERKAKLNIAKTSLENGISLEVVSQITGLSLKELEKL
ncbi:Rpn family recombination-promoting nuclease/putative transposase [Candidatus Cetobacterium colombiensis]|uniref:Rpn family recombination-promoting nuclease/putative transposase n=1 Tax=Candidatus Cetobacterium colombiensis TaxID=3073100 RepID=A0ABU4W5W7_9FUSO|nr:Rpn family recombination-promoting nuclease/putative transposase [Candidatus Cetobacterium colombiensis]MDX8334921.1 Rpn family recombination-promoting nuclease/putative transposase [Candidatus Cetobacterium colombiensis]